MCWLSLTPHEDAAEGYKQQNFMKAGSAEGLSVAQRGHPVLPVGRDAVLIEVSASKQACALDS